MESGIIRSYGKQALTIQTENKKQYYAPFKNIDECVKKCIGQGLQNIPVKFNINYNISSGKTRFGMRYYAEDVELDLIF